jgi:hypothetical protein
MGSIFIQFLAALSALLRAGPGVHMRILTSILLVSSAVHAQGSANTHALEAETFFVNAASLAPGFGGVDSTRVIQHSAAN